MSTVKWRGDAVAVAQVSTVTITGNDVSTTYKITINGKVVSVVGNAGGVNSTASDLKTALAASTIAEFLEITFTVATATITMTAVTAGKPFTATSSVSGGAGTIGAVATPTASSGPNHWDTAANWSGGAVPVNSDDVYLENSDVDILYGLAQSAVTLTTLNIAASYTGDIGLPNFTGQYYEYRATELAIGSTTISIGAGPGTGSGRMRINCGSVQTTLLVYNTGLSTETGVEALRWRGTHASNVVQVNKGSVGIARDAGHTATVATLHVGYVSNANGDANVECGSGLTLTTLNQSGSVVTLRAGLTTVVKANGTLNTYAGNITTIKNDGGTWNQLGTGTVTTLNVGNSGKADFTKDMRAKTVTNCNLYAGAELTDAFGTVTFTNPIQLARCRVSDCKLDFGENRTVAIAGAA